MNPNVFPGTVKSAIARCKKVLVAAGFPWSKTEGRYEPFGRPQRITDGVKVTRVGRSKTVALTVRVGRYDLEHTGRKLIEACAIATLREAGLPVEFNGWMQCLYGNE